MADRPTASSSRIDACDIASAAERIAGRVRRVTLAPVDRGSPGTAGAPATFALEYLQHTGSFKARGAANLAAAHQQAGTLPEAGVVIASGGNAGLACAWAARATGTRATVFVPVTAPAVKVAKLRGYGADVRQVGSEYADALAASRIFAAESGALLSHAYDNPLIAAGAGTLAAEILADAPGKVDTVVVAVGGGGLFAGTAAALAGTGIRTVAVEPENCRALNAALADPELKRRYADVGSVPMIISPTGAHTRFAADTEMWGKVVKQAGLKPE